MSASDSATGYATLRIQIQLNTNRSFILTTKPLMKQRKCIALRNSLQTTEEIEDI